MDHLTLPTRTAAPQGADASPRAEAAASVGDFFDNLFRERTPQELVSQYRALSLMYLAQGNVPLSMVYQQHADRLQRQIDANQVAGSASGESTASADQAREAAERARQDAYWAQPGALQADGSTRREGPTPRGGASSRDGYIDASGRPSDRAAAKRLARTEYDTNGAVIAEAYRPIPFARPEQSVDYWDTPGTPQPDGSIRRDGPTPNGGTYSLERSSTVTGGRAQFEEYDAEGLLAMSYGEG